METDLKIVSGGVKVHLGVDPDFRPARKAHLGLLVRNLQGLVAELRSEGHEVTDGEPLGSASVVT